MQPKSVWEYIALGIDLGILRVAEIFPQVKEWEDDPENTVFVISPEKLIEKFEKLDLLGARGIARALMGTHFPGHTELYLDALFHVLESESDRIPVFDLSPKRLDSKKLLNNVAALFASGVFESLHEVAQYDFMEAGKCIAFDLPTAAAFHLMRGTEMVLRQFYKAMTGKDAGRKFWGDLVKDLQATQTSSLEPLYDHLDDIRKNFRNPTQHPDKIYNIDEAQDLFGVCIDVVDQMIPIIMKQQDKNLE